MAIRSILAAFNGAPSAESALRAALSLAREREAFVTGVLAHGVARARAHLSPWLTDELDRMIARQEAEAREAIESKFWEIVGADMKDHAAFADVAADPSAAVADYARAADLVCIGRYEAQAGAEHYAPSPDVVALQCGRPVLITPPDCACAARFASAVIAWDGKRAAARALGDAIHLLAPGAAVRVVSVGDDETAYRREHRDPVTQLGRHGFDAEFKLLSAHRKGIAQALLDAVADAGAEMLVMGAYEHSKFSEDLLGGVTAHVLRHAPTPVLMAH